MRNVGRKLAFVLAATNHGTMIVNRFDSRETQPGNGTGVGHQLLEGGAHDPVAVELTLHLIEARRRFHGEGVVAIDCGANIGVHAVEWAIATTGWGSVIAIEAQERIYYALAGNIAINNCFNAIAMHAAVAAAPGIINIPSPDYLTPSNFGGLELKPRADTEFIGQAIDYSDDTTVAVQQISLDAMNLSRVDLIKLDVEGMELEALDGARQLIETCRPIIIVDFAKVGAEPLRAWLDERGYRVVDAGMNLMAIHRSDPTINELQIPEQQSAQPSAA
jgi:FkbM family methyltransferase